MYRKSGTGAHILFLVPESEGNVLEAVCIRHTSNAVLAPAKGARSRHVVREIYEALEKSDGTEGEYSRLQASPSALQKFVSSIPWR